MEDGVQMQGGALRVPSVPPRTYQCVRICHAINTRVLINNANKAVNLYGGIIVLLS